MINLHLALKNIVLISLYILRTCNSKKNIKLKIILSTSTHTWCNTNNIHNMIHTEWKTYHINNMVHTRQYTYAEEKTNVLHCSKLHVNTLCIPCIAENMRPLYQSQLYKGTWNIFPLPEQCNPPSGELYFGSSPGGLGCGFRFSMFGPPGPPGIWIGHQEWPRSPTQYL